MDTKGTLSSPYPSCYIIMPHFSQHKGDDDRWFSQPFYSAPGGYKLCLCVDASGRGFGAGTHTSLSIFLMKGENDHQLQWLFEHDVTCGILNWNRDERHVIYTIHFKDAPTQVKLRVTLRERAERGWGFARFLSHTSLHDSGTKNVQYLHEDCLCLQVLKVEPPQ